MKDLKNETEENWDEKGIVKNDKVEEFDEMV